MARPQDAVIRQIVRAYLAEQFGDVEIVAINVRHEPSGDDDHVLTITVVFDGKAKQLDSMKTSKIVRHVRPKIEELGERAFPVFSFVARSDLGKISPEAA